MNLHYSNVPRFAGDVPTPAPQIRQLNNYLGPFIWRSFVLFVSIKRN